MHTSLSPAPHGPQAHRPRRRPGRPVAAGRVLPALVLLLLACNSQPQGGGDLGGGGSGDGGTAEAPAIPGLRALEITPAMSTLTASNPGAPSTQALRATGHFDGAPDQDLTARVAWRSDNSAVATVNGAGLLSTTNQAGGRVRVTASAGAVSGSAVVDVLFQPIIKAPGAPTDAEVLLPPTAMGTMQAGKSPVPVYPSGGTVFPRNLYKVLFQWDAGTGNDLFRLEFKGEHLVMSVYTTLDRFEPTAAQWAFMAQSSAGGKVTWTVYGTSRAAPAQLWRSAPLQLGFSKDPVEGAIYYWSTTVSGVRRATVSDAGPVNFFTPQQAGKCVACHTLSRNGLRLAADVGGQTLGVVDVKQLTPPVINWSQDIDTAWTTFNPDASQLVTASKGILTLRSAQTGAALGTVATGTGKYGTQPDWSPDGKLLSFALSAVNKDRGISGSSIATVEYSGGAFRNLKVIVASTSKDDSLYYPSFSPDSRYLAFVRATGGSDNNNTARVYVVPADGSKPPVELTLANSVVSNQTLVGTAAQLADTMPTWAPTRPGELAFLAFTSIRAYGKIYKYKDVKQIWVSALDLSALAAAPTADPSAPAFRLPFQDLDENTHRPFWAEDALAPPPPPPPPDGGTGGDGGMCLPRGADCRSGAPCCAPQICTNVGDSYTCEPLG